ncbi:hypothetical protein Tco_0957825 [Tanacetum coccineum]
MVMARLRMFVAEEPIVAASCLIGGFGLFLPAFVRPMLDSFASSKQVPPPALSDVSTAPCHIIRIDVDEFFSFNLLGLLVA